MDKGSNGRGIFSRKYGQKQRALCLTQSEFYQDHAGGGVERLARITRRRIKTSWRWIGRRIRGEKTRVIALIIGVGSNKISHNSGMWRN